LWENFSKSKEWDFVAIAAAGFPPRRDLDRSSAPDMTLPFGEDAARGSAVVERTLSPRGQRVLDLWSAVRVRGRVARLAASKAA